MKPTIGTSCSKLFILIIASFITTNAPARAITVSLETARWDEGQVLLLLEGQSDTLNKVFLSDALTGDEIASAQADGDGNWQVNVEGLLIVPCRVRALSGGSFVESDVQSAPANCSSAGLPPELTAKLFSRKHCNTCHGDDGSGLYFSPDIRGKETYDVQRAIAEEDVHTGIDVTPQEVAALVAFLDNPGPLPLMEVTDFSDPEQCRICHPRQYREWSGNMMAYSALSPTFSALEALGNAYSVSLGLPGFAAGNHATALFCQSCHNPADTFLASFPSLPDSDGHALRDFGTQLGRGGISCDVCHQISQPNTTPNPALGRLGDGIANTAFTLEPGITKFGPLNDPQPNPVHASAHGYDINMQSGYLKSGEFCGSCHDVRTPPDGRLASAVDPVTNEPFQRLENLFTEWKNGPYGPINNTVGRVVTCQDCHMDLGPPEPAGKYAEGETTVFPRPSYVYEREQISTHYFTGIDIALVDFPGQDDAALDEYGNVIGQVQRRKQLLQSAARIAVSAPTVAERGTIVPITVSVTNSGTGHNLPSGFSQERQIWIEFIVSDKAGRVVYESGTLVDTAHPETGELVPDGNLDDEDLRNLVGPDGVSSSVIDPITLEANVIHGPDYNRRHEDPPIYTGLANFGNEFIRIPVDENGEPMRDDEGHFIEEEVFMPFLSTHTDNSHSIAPLETERVRYDVTIPADIESPLHISARLRARAFPPRFLRALAAGRPDLVNEKMVDRNRVVDMVSATPISVLVP